MSPHSGLSGGCGLDLCINLHKLICVEVDCLRSQDCGGRGGDCGPQISGGFDMSAVDGALRHRLQEAPGPGSRREGPCRAQETNGANSGQDRAGGMPCLCRARKGSDTER